MKKKIIILITIFFLNNCSYNFIEPFLNEDDHQSPQQLIDKYQSLIQKNPTKADYYAKLAKNYSLLNQNDAALEKINKAISIKAFNSDYYDLKGKICLKKELLFEALNAFSSALKLDPNRPETYYQLGQILYQTGKPEQALEALNNAISLDELYFDAQLAKIKIQFESAKDVNNFPELIQKLKQLLLIKPASIPANLLLSRLNIAIGNTFAAEMILKKSLQITNQNDQILLKLAELYFFYNQLNQAEELLKEIKNQTTLSFKILSLKIHLQKRNWKKFNQLYSKMLEKKPSMASLYVLKARQYYLQNHLKQAQQELERSLQLAPKLIEAYLLKAKILENNANYAGARVLLENAANLAPTNLNLKIHLWELMIKEGQAVKVASLIDQLEIQKNKPSFLALKGAIALQQGNLNQAFELYTKALQGQNSLIFNHQLALIEIQQGKIKAAQKRLTKARQFFPHHYNIIFTQAQLFYKTQQWGNIPKIIRPILNSPEENGRAHILLAEAYEQLRKKNQALKILAQAFNKWPYHLEIINYYTFHLMNAGQYRKASIILEETLENYHQFLPLLKLRLAECYYKTQQSKKYQQQLFEYNHQKLLVKK